MGLFWMVPGGGGFFWIVVGIFVCWCVLVEMFWVVMGGGGYFSADGG